MRDWPAPSRMVAKAWAGSTPARSAKASTSAAAAVCTVTNRLARYFIFEPAPKGPTRCTARLKAARTGAHASRASSGPDAYTTRSPARAWAPVPLTGQSSRVTPTAARRARPASLAGNESVLVSTTRSAPFSSPTTAAKASSDGSDSNTTSTPAPTTSATLATGVVPSITREGSASWATTPKPASTRWRANAPPMVPTPIRPTLLSPTSECIVRIQAGGIDVHCEIDGPDSGRPLLCLHSLATDMTVWDAQVPAFTATGFRVVRVDLRGHGGTTATPPPYTLDLLVADAVAVLDALDIGRCSVLGLSLGGMIAMGLALDHPERVDKLVVGDARADAPPPYVALWDGIIERAHAEGMAAVVDASIQRWFTPAFV